MHQLFHELDVWPEIRQEKGCDDDPMHNALLCLMKATWIPGVSFQEPLSMTNTDTATVFVGKVDWGRYDVIEGFLLSKDVHRAWLSIDGHKFPLDITFAQDWMSSQFVSFDYNFAQADKLPACTYMYKGDLDLHVECDTTPCVAVRGAVLQYFARRPLLIEPQSWRGYVVRYDGIKPNNR
jgi:hypothetical protein